MRVMEIKEFGAPEMLVSATRPDPVAPAAGTGEILIKVIAAGINRPDVLQRKGHYPVPAGASDIPGLEVAGEIVGGDLAHADNLFGLKVGDKVCALVQGGGYAELCTAPIAQCLPYPKGFTDQEAASLPETFTLCGATSSCVASYLKVRPCWYKVARVALVLLPF